ncbi:MAG: hypothetical protein IT238_08940 [Bacteroidia bacterium]|nr:hypothetical protein [Bacteroidia bacterium]MCZ2248718.1 hypothetical protein [Bacteroidia bacterium]
MDSNEQYSVSPRSGRLRKKVRIRKKKKRNSFSKSKLKKFLSNPILILLIIALLTLITYFFMPKYTVYRQKYKQAQDNNTQKSNKRIQETDVYN